MSPREREPGLGVLERRGFPCLRAVASLAATLSYPGVDFAPMGIAMAGGAANGREAEAGGAARRSGWNAASGDPTQLARGHRTVASVARYGEVRSVERVGGRAMLLDAEAGRREAVHVVAGLAGAPVGAADELAEVDIRVAVLAAAVPERPRPSRCVATIAREANVAATQRVRRPVMVEA